MSGLNIWQIGLIMSFSVTKQDVATEASQVSLPGTVQRYLRYTGIVGKEKTNTVRLKQNSSKSVIINQIKKYV